MYIMTLIDVMHAFYDMIVICMFVDDQHFWA